MNQKNETKAELWQARIDRWRESGIAQSRYCRENNLSPAVFCYWKRRLSGSNNNVFYELPLQDFRKDKLKLIIPGGITITFEKTTNLNTITTVLEALCASNGTK